MIRFHILHNSGWVGNSDQRPAHKKKEPMQPLLPGDIEVNKQTITIHEADWSRANMLMPIFVRQLMRDQQEKTADQELLDREYADDAEPNSNILLPVGVRG